MNWDAGIRTPISRSRVCGPTVGRRPKDNGKIVTERLKRMLPLGMFLQVGSRFTAFPFLARPFNYKIGEDGGVQETFYISNRVVIQRSAHFISKSVAGNGENFHQMDLLRRIDPFDFNVKESMGKRLRHI